MDESDINEQKLAFFDTNFAPNGRAMRIYRIASFVAFAYFFACVWICHAYKTTCWAKALACTWIIGPPLWFYLEYVVLLGPFGRRHGVDGPRSVAGFKYTQDLATKLWVAMALIVAYAVGVKP